MLSMIGRLFCKRHTIYNIIHTNIYIKTLIYDIEAAADCVLLSYFKLKNEEIIHYTSIYNIKQ